MEAGKEAREEAKHDALEIGEPSIIGHQFPMNSVFSDNLSNSKLSSFTPSTSFPPPRGETRRSTEKSNSRVMEKKGTSKYSEFQIKTISEIKEERPSSQIELLDILPIMNLE